jgi:hypothetical protein
MGNLTIVNGSVAGSSNTGGSSAGAGIGAGSASDGGNSSIGNLPTPIPAAMDSGPSVALIVPLTIVGVAVLVVSLWCLFRWVQARKRARRSDGTVLPLSDALTGPV